MRLSASFFLIALAAFAPLAHCDESRSHQWKRIAKVLEKDNSADSLVAAALIHADPRDDERRALANIDRAQLLAPNDPDIVWLGIMVCPYVMGCDPLQRSAQLQRLDPANAAGHYYALSKARYERDVPALDRALAAMAEAQRFDTYLSRLLVRSVDALTLPRGAAQRPLRDISHAGRESRRWLVTITIPTLSEIDVVCGASRLRRADVLEWCRKLVYVLDNGDTWWAVGEAHAVARDAWKDRATRRPHGSKNASGSTSM